MIHENDFGVANLHPSTDAEKKAAGWRDTGEEMWDAMSKAEQNALVGEKVADAIRRGDIDLADLVDRSADDFITGKPAQDLGIDTEG